MASFCGGAVGVLSTLLVVEVNNKDRQAAQRCVYCEVKSCCHLVPEYTYALSVAAAVLCGMLCVHRARTEDGVSRQLMWHGYSVG